MCSIEQLRFPISPIVKVSVSLPLGVCVCLIDWVVAILTTIQERSLATQQHLLLQVRNPTFHPRSTMKFYPLLETRSNIVRRTKSEPSLDYSLLPPDKTYSVQHVLPQWVLLLSPAASAQGNREFPQTHTHTDRHSRMPQNLGYSPPGFRWRVLYRTGLHSTTPPPA